MIAFLGWGSLVWDQGELPTRGRWEIDGPLVKVEYVRQSSDQRLTLVLTHTAAPVPSLWTPFDGDGLEAARQALRARERIPQANVMRHVGTWSPGEQEPELIDGLALWAQRVGAAAVVWTALPPKFNNEDGNEPTVEEALTYLRALPENSRVEAERYVCRTPPQIDTLYRRRFVADLGWICANL